jgi:hypothetical protein
VSDGNAAHDSSASMMKMARAIEQVYPQAPNFAATKLNAQAKSSQVKLPGSECQRSGMFSGRAKHATQKITSSFHILIIWFSSTLGSLSLGIGTLFSSRPMDFNKRLKSTFDCSLVNKPELGCPSLHFFELSNQPRETLMSDLGLQLRKVSEEPDRLPAEGRLGR